jgi:hypothetical protein
MYIINKFIGDDVKAKYSNAKFYIKEIVFLIAKAAGIFILSMFFFTFLFLIITPDDYKTTLRPVF